VIVHERQINGLIKADQSRILPTGCRHEQQKKHRSRGE
jgi:hypothetical protein